MWINCFTCHALKFNIGELSSFGKTEKFCTIKFFKNNEKIYRLQCWLSGKSWSPESKSPIFGV